MLRTRVHNCKFPNRDSAYASTTRGPQFKPSLAHAILDWAQIWVVYKQSPNLEQEPASLLSQSRRRVKCHCLSIRNNVQSVILIVPLQQEQSATDQDHDTHFLRFM